MADRPSREELEKRIGELEDQVARVRSEAIQYRTLFNCFPHGITVSDDRGNIIQTNEIAEKLLGVSKREHETRSIDGREWRLVRPDGSDMPSEEWPSVIALKENRVLSGCEMGISKPDGKVTWISVTAAPLPLEGHGVVITYNDISEKKQAEEALRESERRLRRSRTELQRTLEATTDGIWTWDFRTNELFFSPRYYTMLGYEPNEFSPSFESWSTLIHPDDLENAMAVARQYLETKTDRYENEFRLRTRDGAYRWIRTIGRVVERGPNGEARYMIGNHEDITERKHSERALRQSEGKLKTLFEAIPLPVFFKDTHGVYLGCNSAFCTFLGMTKEEIIGQTVYTIAPREIADQYFIKDRELLEHPGCQSYEWKVVNAGGDLRDVIFSKATFTDANGAVAGIIGTIIDITERKRMEQELWEASELFQKVFNGQSDAILILDAKMPADIIACNSASEALFGYRREELIGATVSKLHVDEAHLRHFQAHLHDAVQAGESLNDFPFSMKHRDGSIFPSEHSVFEIKSDQGRRTGWVSIIRDQTERKRMEARLQQAQKMESIGNLAGGIAHDFNNILFPILGMAEMLLEDLPPQSPERESAGEILQAAKRGSGLVKQILAFSRQSEHQMIPVPPQQILREVLRLARSTIPTYIPIAHDIQKDCGLVIADPVQLHQVAMNLLTNAYHAVEEGGGNIHLALKEVDLRSEDLNGRDLDAGRHALFTVTDTGAGIDAAIMDKLFDPYFTTKEKGKGTGLGLAVVYGIIREHRGDIRIDSAPGRGTTVTVTLPMLKGALKTAPVAALPEDLPTGSERILLVDDEEPVARLERQILERLGYRTTSRLNSTEALEVFKAEPAAFDLVLTDMTMPNLTGVQLAREILSIRPDIPVVICTGFSERIDQQKAESMGVKGLLMKPVVKQEMARMIRRVLDERKDIGPARSARSE